MSQSKKAFEKIKWKSAYHVSLVEEDWKSDLSARREVGKFLSERMKAILLEGYQVPGITARYAVNHYLRFQKESGEYEETSL